MRILIVDDHIVVRLGLSAILKSEYPRAEISEAGKEAEVYMHLQKHHYDLMLMDLSMPETDSMAMLEQSIRINPNLKVLVVSFNPERLFALRYVKAGASGYVQKSENDAMIIKAVRTVMNGNTFLSEDMVEEMALYLKHGNTFNPFQRLSKREFEVAIHCINGLTPGEIGRVMALQSPTVSIYKNRIFEKLNIKSLHELIKMAKQYDLE
ncbi:MAG: response regulator transcription factor [Bacteroidota bacterium]